MPPSGSYQVRFTAKKHDPQLTVPVGCLVDQIAVNGAAQPLLWDTRGGLVKIIRDLMGR